VMDVRGGAMNQSAFGQRMKGEGPRWKAARDLFELTVTRLGYARGEIEMAKTFRRVSQQGTLF